MLEKPQAIISFLESDGCDHLICLVVSLSGDTDTFGSMESSIAKIVFQ